MSKNTTLSASVQKGALGVNIADARRAAKKSQAELAAECDSSRNYVSAIERGVAVPGPKMLARIAAALGVSETDLRSRNVGGIANEDVELLAVLKSDPEKYLAARELARLDHSRVFSVRVKMREDEAA